MSLPVTASPNAVAHAKLEITPKSPAKAAREYLAENPDAVGHPFGKLVSQFAKDKSSPTA